MLLTEEQTMISDMAKNFAMNELRPNAAKWDKDGNLDRSKLEALGELGFGGIYTSEEHGGSGLTRLDAALIFEQLSRRHQPRSLPVDPQYGDMDDRQFRA